MKTPSDASAIPAEMLDKLHAVLRHQRRIRLQTGLARACAVLLAAMLLMMAIDWLAAPHEGPWRWIMTISAFACGGAALLLGCAIPLFRRSSLDSVAEQVDRAHPALQERCQTTAEFAHSNDQPEIRGSEGMIRKVAQQMAAMSGIVVPGAVVSKQSLVRAAWFFGAAAAVLALFFAVDSPRATVLCERFFKPGADITLTRLQSKTGDLVIGKGEKVTLEFTATGKAPDSAKLLLHPAAGRDEVVSLEKSAKDSANGASKFVYIADSVDASFDYSARAGDGRTAVNHVTVLERPALKEVQFQIEAPAYSRLPLVSEKSLPRQVRALEGSKLDISFLPDQELAALELKLSDGSSLPLQKSAGNRYHFSALLTNTFAFEPVLTTPHQLVNQSPPNCEIIVYQDQPPTVNITSPAGQISARPDDKIQIEFQARDDFGLARAELVVSVTSETGSNSPPVTIPIPLDTNELGSKFIQKRVELDLSQFNLKQDQELNYSVRVTDTKNDSTFSTPRPDANAAAQAQISALAAAQNQNSQTNGSSNPSQQDTAQNQSQSNTNQSPQNTGANQSRPETAQNQSQTNNAGNQQQNQNPPPPPNNMSKRTLDTPGQTASAQQMRIEVDEWARSFEGQVREKQELAIDPTLKLLDDLLRKAQELTDANLAAAQSPEGLGVEQSWTLGESKDQVRQADRAVADLKKDSLGTAYAFIGLQVSDIGDTHITPAREELGEVTLESAQAKEDRDNLAQASFHLDQARKMLADLTKTYESVKRDNQIADAVQELKKMRQIFLEDTQALLGSKKPPINSVPRKIAEVDDDFAAKLEALLKEQQKIMAELAKILANDPRMLRRFMALQELDSATLRDQMTLLAQRQQTLASQTAQWTAAPDTERPAQAAKFLTAQIPEQVEIASLAAKMRENMITWLPDGVEQDKEPVATALSLSAEGARLAALAASQASPNTITNSLQTARKALDQFRLLHDYLPDMADDTNTQNLGVFTANRLEEAADLVTKQSGWIKKMESLRDADFPQAAEVDQHRLALDTATLNDKLDAQTPAIAALSDEIQAKSDQLLHTVEKQVLPDETRAVDALGRKTLKDAVSRQADATNAFAQAETQFDDLLRLIVAKLDSAPPPSASDVGQNPTLEEMLAMLQDEKKAAEKLGIPNRPLNIQLMTDWLSQNSSQQAGGQSRQARAQARAAQQRARDNSDRTARASEQARRNAQARAAQLTQQGVAPDNINEGGPKSPSNAWNTLASKLGDELRQSRDNIPPEQYRQAIEQYFNSISETIPAIPPPSPAPAP